ncbi:MAG: hypothetical protein IT373_13295, partial [Polyangiaceae bacterium]|nr:hypothetical protein [Polyangiaceae bacterium]
MDEATGSIGTYKIVRRLAGAGADLFLVRSAAGARRVLQMVEADDPDALDEARQQLAVAATLEHAAIDRPVDVFDHEGKLVIAYDEFDGLTLAEVLEELVDHGRSVPPQAVWYLAYQIFGALARAHSATDANGDFVALCHGHLAPAHVLVGPQGELRIRGFGLAPVVGAVGTRGVALTPGYAAPEQKGAARVTPRGDVYSAAAIVWALGAAQRPADDGGKLPVSALVPAPPPQLAQALDTALELALPKRKVTSIEIEQHFEALVSASGRTALKEAV